MSRTSLIIDGTTRAVFDDENSAHSFPGKYGVSNNGFLIDIPVLPGQVLYFYSKFKDEVYSEVVRRVDISGLDPSRIIISTTSRYSNVSSLHKLRACQFGVTFFSTEEQALAYAEQCRRFPRK